MKSPTEKGGTASVSHSPTEKKRRNNTEDCAFVNNGSVTNHVNKKAANRHSTKEIICLFFLWDFALIFCFHGGESSYNRNKLSCL